MKIDLGSTYDNKQLGFGYPEFDIINWYQNDKKIFFIDLLTAITNFSYN